MRLRERTFGLFRAQSAMEYLMTYGWAILIIAIVLGALFSLGVFTPNLTTACVATSGWSCSQMVLHSSGGVAPNPNLMTFTVGQNTGQTLFNAIVSVTTQGTSLNSLGFPTTVAAQNGAAASCGGLGNDLDTWLSGQTNSAAVSVSSTLLTSNALGASMAGFVWVNYSTVGCTSKATSAQKVASFTVKVT